MTDNPQVQEAMQRPKQWSLEVAQAAWTLDTRVYLAHEVDPIFDALLADRQRLEAMVLEREVCGGCDHHMPSWGECDLIPYGDRILHTFRSEHCCHFRTLSKPHGRFTPIGGE